MVSLLDIRYQILDMSVGWKILWTEKFQLVGLDGVESWEERNVMMFGDLP